MKTKLLFFFFIIVCFSYAQTNYDKGYVSGYLKGYCYKANYNGKTCIEPLNPTSPLPKLGESYDSYNDGYNRGYVEGISAYDNTTTTTRKPYQYAAPETLSIAPLGNATMILQNRYDNNTATIQSTINTITNEVNNLDTTDEKKQLILQKFNDVPIKSLNNQTINYSSQTETNKVIAYLYESINKIIKNIVTVNSNNLETVSYEGITNIPNYIRDAPNSDAKYLILIPFNTKISVVNSENSNGFIKIQYNDTIGYIEEFSINK